MNDWPQDKPPPYPPDDEALATPRGYRCTGCGAWDTSPRTDGKCSNGSPTGGGCAWVPAPPPDVWEFYRRNSRWPEEGEA